MQLISIIKSNENNNNERLHPFPDDFDRDEIMEIFAREKIRFFYLRVEGYKFGWFSKRNLYFWIFNGNQCSCFIHRNSEHANLADEFLKSIFTENVTIYVVRDDGSIVGLLRNNIMDGKYIEYLTRPRVSMVIKKRVEQNVN